jgi:hypothetical protein
VVQIVIDAAHPTKSVGVRIQCHPDNAAAIAFCDRLGLSFNSLNRFRHLSADVRRTGGKFFHIVGDNRRQLHYPLTQFCVSRNVALNALAVTL